MKTKSFFRSVILLPLLISVLFACKKESDLTGQLKVSFANKSGDITMLVYAIENTDFPISSFKLDISGNGSTELNMGNYMVKVSSGINYSSIGVQIKPNQTTSIFWGTDNQPYIQ